MQKPLFAAMAVLCASAFPTIAAAQSATSPVPEICANTTIWVANQQAVEVKGKLLSQTPDAVEVVTSAGIKRVPMYDVWVITRKDSNANGFWIGAAVGGASGYFTFKLAEEVVGAPRGFGAVMGVMGAVTYGLLGAWVDSWVDGRVPVYRRPGASAGPTVAVAPVAVLGRGKGVGLAATVRWR
jgi:hypothetical protein